MRCEKINPESFKNITLEMESQIIEWRRHLHKNPEVSNKEYQTSQFIEETLISMEGIEVSKPTKTSVLGILKGNKKGKILAIRADIDALSIQEENEVDYKSINHSAMHACGHDGHVAMLLGTAKVLSKLREHIKGEVRFIFQHAEEIYPGGAVEIINTGILNDVDMVIGTHLWTPFHSGKVGICAGPTMGGNNKFWITVNGKGGHAALPHETQDPILMGAQIINNLQSIVSRKVSAFEPLVVSITQFHAGSTGSQVNVIPDKAEIAGTFRYMAPDLSKKVAEEIEKIVKGITIANQSSYDIKFQYGYVPVVNDKQLTEKMAESISEIVGSKNIEYIKPIMASDDFSEYCKIAPICYFFMGAGNKKEASYPHHHPKFNIDESVLKDGVNIFVNSTFKLLS